MEKINVFKAKWDDFLKFCEKESLAYDNYDDYSHAMDRFIAEALRVKTKYDN